MPWPWAGGMCPIQPDWIMGSSRHAALGALIHLCVIWSTLTRPPSTLWPADEVKVKLRVLAKACDRPQSQLYKGL